MAVQNQGPARRINAFWLIMTLYSVVVTSGWSLPRMTSPTYSRKYTYWKQIDPSVASSGTSENNSNLREELEESYSYTEAFRNFGVQRPAWKAPPFVWKWAHRLFMKILPLLHAFEDKNYPIPPESSLCLPILWWKALLHRTNPSAGAWAYDLLPSKTRWIARFKWFFPPLHHKNVQLRTTFLDDRASTIATQARSDGFTNIRLVVLGAGYDLRSLRFLEKGIVDEAIELDLPNVIDAKKALLNSSIFQRRRPSCKKFPVMVGADLNDDVATKETLGRLLLPKEDPIERTFTIFLLEGVLVHLESGSTQKILRLLRDLSFNEESSCLVFCDYIRGVTNRSLHLAQEVLHKTGWELSEFLATPTKTPHFGVARCVE